MILMLLTYLFTVSYEAVFEKAIYTILKEGKDYTEDDLSLELALMIQNDVGK